MDEIVQFVRDRYDEEESRVRALPAGPWEWKVYEEDDSDTLAGPDGPPVLASGDAEGYKSWIDRHEAFDAYLQDMQPDRVLADVEAKRVLIARGGPFCTSDCDEPGNQPMDPESNWTTPLEHHFDCAAYEAAKVLALPYADHPAYREEWRP